MSEIQVALLTGMFILAFLNIVIVLIKEITKK